MFSSGYTKLFSVRGIPVRVHFSILLGFFLISGGAFVPGAWLGYFVILVVHELGHAFLAMRYKLYVDRIDLHALGGYCLHEGSGNAFQTSVIAWGGVLGQLLLFVLGITYAMLGPDPGTYGAQFLNALGRWNLIVMALNLVPLNGLDGREAWRLPRLAYQRWQKARIRRRLVKPSGTRKKQPRLESAGEPKLKLVRDEKGDFRFEHEEAEKEES
jgi:stage IV sporulation protein FB